MDSSGLQEIFSFTIPLGVDDTHVVCVLGVLEVLLVPDFEFWGGKHNCIQYIWQVILTNVPVESGIC